MRLAYKYFSANGSWVAPAGVTRVFLIGHGGGGGGCGGGLNIANAAKGGHGTIPFMAIVDVVPNTSYTVTIGAGGAGGAARASGVTNYNGSAGGNTTFGALQTFAGAQALGSAGVPPTTPFSIHANGDEGIVAANANYSYSNSGYKSYQNARSGAGQRAGADDPIGGGKGGMGGAGGYFGSTGGTGGAGGQTTGAVGAAATLGGGGGGGGGAGVGGTSGGVGGQGGGGQLWVAWVE